MKINVHTQKIELNENQVKYIEEKLQSLKRYSDLITDDAVLVKVSVEKNVSLEQKRKVIMRVTMSVPKALFRAEVNAFTSEEAIDLIHDKLHRQIERYKTKHLKFENLTAAEVVEADSNINRQELDPRITKRKLFSDLIPMTETEALDQMLMLGHTFFVFVNSSTDRYNLLYTRPDGQTYGLVELEHQDGVIN